MTNLTTTPVEHLERSHSQSLAQLEITQLEQIDILEGQETGQDVVSGLTQGSKSLPPKYFYDKKGSLLFEQICELPEYYPTRTEAWILQQYAEDIAQTTGQCELVELGSGSSTKTRALLDAYQSFDCPLRYLPIDVSGTILEASAQQLHQDYDALQIQGLVGTYDRALAYLKATPSTTRLLFFLGSSIGNFSPESCDQFLDQIVDSLQPGDYFLLGMDLQKPIETIEAAYNDAQNVTAQFNLNMLDHLNWRFKGNFDANKFEHWAFYNQSCHRIEMHLRCLETHQVQLEDLDLTADFEAGETILTEISRKFNLETLQTQLQSKGFQTLKTWTDPQAWFGLILCQVNPA